MATRKIAHTDLDLLAERVYNYLLEEGAVRIDEDTVGAYRSVFVICSDLVIDNSQWIRIKNRMSEIGKRNGWSIVFVQGRGHYIGWPGEEITNDVARFKIAMGWMKHLHKSRRAIENCSPKQAFWIERRYKNHPLEDEVKVNA